ncbi:MAG: hypothetical protein AAF509_12800 [Pseudomonadota bacterium]
MDLDREENILAYVQGKMSGDEKRAFEAALSADQGLAAEVQVMQTARQTLAQTAVPQGATDEGWARLSRSLTSPPLSAPAPANENQAPLRFLAQAAAIAVASVALWHFAVAPTVFPANQPTYQAASDEVGQAEIRVMFQPNATLGEVSALLDRLEGSIVSGPSALGTYAVQFADEALRARAIQELEARRDLFASVFVQ